VRERERESGSDSEAEVRRTVRLVRRQVFGLKDEGSLDLGQSLAISPLSFVPIALLYVVVDGRDVYHFGDQFMQSIVQLVLFCATIECPIRGRHD